MEMDSFLRLPRVIAKRKDLTLPAKMVYQALNGFAWGDKVDAWPSVARLAEEIGESTDTVRRGLKVLVEKGLVTIEHRKDPEKPKQNLSNIYHIVPLLATCDNDSSQPASTSSGNMQGKVEAPTRRKEKYPPKDRSSLSSSTKSNHGRYPTEPDRTTQLLQASRYMDAESYGRLYERLFPEEFLPSNSAAD